MESYEYVSWALAVDLPHTPKAIGEKAVRLVLVCLANHANTKGLAWPSRSTIASEVNGLAPRDVQNALALLEEGKCLTRVESGKGKRTVYRLACHRDGKADGVSRRVPSPKPDVAPDGLPDVAPDGAPDVIPRHEWNGMKWNPSCPPKGRHQSSQKGEEVETPCSASLRETVQRHGVPGERVDDVWRFAQNDPDTAYPAQRLEKSRQYTLQCLEAVKSGRSARLSDLPRCPDHPEEAAAACPPCQADWKVGDRPKHMIGRHWSGE